MAEILKSCVPKPKPPEDTAFPIFLKAFQKQSEQLPQMQSSKTVQVFEDCDCRSFVNHSQVSAELFAVLITNVFDAIPNKMYYATLISCLWVSSLDCFFYAGQTIRG